jgi:hypothetical protein
MLEHYSNVLGGIIYNKVAVQTDLARDSQAKCGKGSKEHRREQEDAMI